MVACVQERYTLGGPGGMLPQENFLKFRVYEIASETNSGPGGQTTEFHMNAILPIASYTNGVSFPIQFACRSKATPFAGEACETNRENGKLLKDSWNSSVALFTAISQVSNRTNRTSGYSPVMSQQ